MPNVSKGFYRITLCVSLIIPSYLVIKWFNTGEINKFNLHPIRMASYLLLSFCAPWVAYLISKFIINGFYKQEPISRFDESPENKSINNILPVDNSNILAKDERIVSDTGVCAGVNSCETVETNNNNINIVHQVDSLEINDGAAASNTVNDDISIIHSYDNTDNNDQQTKVVNYSNKMKPKGILFLVISWILFSIQLLLIFGFIAQYFNGTHVRSIELESLMNRVASSNVAGSIGYLLGVNLITLLGGIFAILTWLISKRNRGLNTIFIFILLLLITSCLQFLPTSLKYATETDISIANNIHDEMSSMWDEINKGHLVQPKEYTEAEYGNLKDFMKLTNSWIISVQNILIEMNREIQYYDTTSLLKPETLTNNNSMSLAHETLNKLTIITDKYETKLAMLFEDYPEQILQIDISEELKKEAIEGFNKSKEHSLDSMLVYFSIEKGFLKEVGNLYSFMESKQDKVSIVNNQLYFVEQKDADQYNNIINNINTFVIAEKNWLENIKYQGVISADRYKNSYMQSNKISVNDENISDNINFYIRFPNKSDVRHYGKITHYTAEVEGEGIYNVFVQYHEELPTSEAEKKEFLKGMLDGRLLASSGNLIKSEEKRFHNDISLNYEYTNISEGVMIYYRGIIFIFGNMSYNISVVCSEDTREMVYAKYHEFVNSFKYIK